MAEEIIRINMPVIALRGLVVFPDQLLHFDVGREKSLAAVNASFNSSGTVFLVSQKSINIENTSMSDLYSTGVVAKIEQVLKVPGKKGLLHISVKGLSRAKLCSLDETGKYLTGEIQPLKSKEIKKKDYAYAVALVRQTKDIFSEYADVAPRMPEDIITNVLEIKDPGRLADYLAGNIMIEYEERQKILENLDPIDRLEEMNIILAGECYLLNIEADISERVQEKIDRNQREYYLQEQIKTISEELNGTSENEIIGYKEKINALNASDEVKSKLIKECNRLEKMSSSSPDAVVSRSYIETCIELPWGLYSEENTDFEKASAILEKDHYGLDKIKQRIIEYLTVSTISPDIRGQIICLVGPPGVGKTSVAIFNLCAFWL